MQLLPYLSLFHVFSLLMAMTQLELNKLLDVGQLLKVSDTAQTSIYQKRDMDNKQNMFYHFMK